MKKSILKKALQGIGVVVILLISAVAVLLAYLTKKEYQPEPTQTAEYVYIEENGPEAPNTLTLYSWNIGYGGLGKESDFFMDGGEMVDPPDQETVERNMAAIEQFMVDHPADAWLLQEVDRSSDRTELMDQLYTLQEAYGGSGAFAYNYKCAFVPIPLPPIGKVESGIATLTGLSMQEDAQRIALPCPFSWPSRVANLKRCLLVTRHAVEGTDKELVLVNLHLEAYDDGEGKAAQTALLLEVLQEEYEKGNYVIAGGDFNQAFPHTLDTFPISGDRQWKPGVLEENALPEGWQYAYDADSATCRLLDRPYDAQCQRYVIDGFIVSPNLQVDGVETAELDFENSDHNPVRLDVTFLS